MLSPIKILSGSDGPPRTGDGLEHDLFRPFIDWVIIGCETGPHRRPMDLEWAIDLVRQCDDARIPVFVKQIEVNGRVSKDTDEWPEALRRREFPGLMNQT
jgi:protein gp37